MYKSQIQIDTLIIACVQCLRGNAGSSSSDTNIITCHCGTCIRQLVVANLSLWHVPVQPQVFGFPCKYKIALMSTSANVIILTTVLYCYCMQRLDSNSPGNMYAPLCLCLQCSLPSKRSGPNRIPVGFLSSFSQQTCTLSAVGTDKSCG